MRNHLLAVVTAVVLGLAAVGLRAQSPGPSLERPAFEAASAKPNKDGGPFNLVFMPGGRFRATNVTVKMLIGAAYGTPQPLPDFQISGGPKWLDTDRFDIVAKAAGDPQPQNNAPPAIMFQMLQSLLEDRFHLKTHRETSDVPVFVLQFAHPDGKLGPKFRPTDTDCAALMRAARESGGPPPPPAPGERPRCGARMFAGNLSAGAMSLAQVVNGLSRTRDLNRQVVDRTGLTGAYDIDLVWTPDAASLPPAGDRPAGAPPLPPIDPNGPSIFTAIQEQWGLKLEPSRAPMNLLVIDAVDRPTDD
jgi:uncharacterized protein (TIGR03435 family)